MNTVLHHAQPSFHEAYPKAPFAALVRLSLLLAGGLVRLRARLAGPDAAAAKAAQPTAR